jgi:hypothetical protein
MGREPLLVRIIVTAVSLRFFEEKLMNAGLTTRLDATSVIFPAALGCVV